MSDSSNAAAGGTSIAGLLGVAFVVLKLTHVIDWPWKWVLAPFWVPIVLTVAIFALIGIGWLIYKAVTK